MDYVNLPLASAQLVPQECYAPPSRNPYVQLPNIKFTVGGVLGIRLVDALNPEFNGLDYGGVVPSLLENGKKITLRLQVRYMSPPSRLYLTVLLYAVAWILAMERCYSRL